MGYMWDKHANFISLPFGYLSTKEVSFTGVKMVRFGEGEPDLFPGLMHLN